MSAWTSASATAMGSSHVRSGLPNQDAHEVRNVDGVTVVAVADGHGGRRYVRSDVGSRFAVQVAVHAAAQWWGRRGSALRVEQLPAAVQAELVPEIVETWTRQVLADFAARPATDEETARAGVDLGYEPLISYGATLLLGILADDVVVIAQLGDGDVCGIGPSGTVSPVPDDDRNVAGQTTSLCLSTAMADFRVVALPAHTAGLFLFATDGYGNSFEVADWQTQVLQDIAGIVGTGGASALDGRLDTWLAESADAGGDDVTVVVAVRDRARPAAVLPAATDETRFADEPARHSEPAASATSRTSWLPLVAGACLAAVIGFLVGTATSGSDAEGTTSTTSAPAVTGGETTSIPTTTSPVTQDPLGREPVVLLGPAGVAVSFIPDPAQPQPIMVPADDTLPSSSARSLAMPDGQQWRVTDDGALQWRQSNDASWESVSLGGPDGFSLAAVDGAIYVLDEDVDDLVVVGASSHDVIGTYPVVGADGETDGTQTPTNDPGFAPG